jgi:tol-pal system protein YbgF
MFKMIRFKWSTAARVLVTAAAVVTLGACATKSDIRDLQSELRALAVRQDSLLAQLRMDALSTQDTIRTQSDQIFDFRGDITRQLRQIAESLSTLEALAGENQRGIAGVRDQLANMRRMPAGPPAGAGPDSTTTDLPVAGGVEGGPDQLYSTAVDQMGRGSLNTARMAFQQFLDAYPNHELAPDAHFFLADILSRQDRPDDAIEAFREIQTLFPTAEKVPDALYRIALIQIDQGKKDDAVETLDRIVNTYPESTIAMIAREKLDEIR